jgi:hypothetical protein
MHLTAARSATRALSSPPPSTALDVPNSTTELFHATTTALLLSSGHPELHKSIPQILQPVSDPASEVLHNPLFANLSISACLLQCH